MIETAAQPLLDRVKVYAGALARLQEQSEDLQREIHGILYSLRCDPAALAERVTTCSEAGSEHRWRIYTHPNPEVEVTFEIDEARKCLHVVHVGVPSPTGRTKVFISYAHEDRIWLERLLKCLDGLSELLEPWDDSRIPPGDAWYPAIMDALAVAKLAILLVSQDFWASDFIKKRELPSILQLARKGGLKIFWIAVRPSPVEDKPVSAYQALNRPDRALSALSQPEWEGVLVEIYRKIKRELGSRSESQANDS